MSIINRSNNIISKVLITICYYSKKKIIFITQNKKKFIYFSIHRKCDLKKHRDLRLTCDLVH